VNALHPIYLLKTLLDQLIVRAASKRVAVVVTASNLAMYPFAGLLTYSCTKTFASFLGEGLSQELAQKNIDCMAW
jgi:short-subunit dehydrogenase